MSALLKQRLLGQPGGCHTTPPNGVRAPSRGPAGDNTPFTSTKGLLNGPGQNNCFLNSAVQVLWHLDVFRRSFRELSGHACMAEACIFCALKELFGQLQFSQESALPPDALRRALAESFFDQQRFQLGFMDDAAECFENILLRIHYHIANGEAEDMCAARHCIPHQKFAMTLVEQSVCEACHVTSEPLSYTQMVHYVSASALTAQARSTAKTSQPDLFGQLLRKAGGMGDIRDCPSSCGAKIQICRALMNRPEVVSVGVVWDSERPTLEHIMSVFATVGTTLRLSDVFHSVVDHRWAAATTHSLVGVVTYYGKHYSTFFFHTKLRLWIYFDDANVREIGPRFEQVVEKCRRGRYQPLLLLYAVQGGTPVSTEGAPKTVVPITVAPRRGKPPSQIPLRRSVTPSPEKAAGVPNPRRAVTPNPDRYADYQNLADIQAAIFPAEEPGYISRQAVESVMSAQNALSRNNSLYEPKRNGVNGDGIAVPDHLNVPRRRDSGNWSGDRNSASSSSSLENPYLCLVGRMRPVPRSPKPSAGDSGVVDPGYDSYSLSSNDSLPLQQQLKHNLQLAQIPEHSAGADDCERLCVESDRLLGKARQLEAACDLETALVVSRAAGDKARRAMDAPYNNPRALSLARMKHNACVMHARSLARRMDETALDIRHSRENSGSSNRSASHSRQSSRDKTQAKPQHSRQSSRELVQPPVVEERKPPPKSIEIYATLPRKKLGSPRAKPIETEEDAEYMYERPGRSLQSRVGLRRDEKKDKRAKSEERKSPRDYSLLNTSSTLPKESPKKDKEKEKEKAKEEKRLKEEAKKNEAKAGKKQHKIRRKLLMGGLIRRKNRSMPDLREGQDAAEPKPVEAVAPSKISQDDAALPDKSDKAMSGYLSEGHLDYGRSNPNLERSRLMRKTSHGAKGRLPPKVPPLPPLRTSSQLTAMEEPRITYEPVTYANGGILGLLDPRFGTFEARTESTQSLALPPYPSPLGSANHSRQPSEEFPPPPPPLDEEPTGETSTLLAQLQIKRQQILEKDASPRSEPAPTPPPTQSSGETWLRELQAKQAERRRRQPPAAPTATTATPDADCASVRDLASRFESSKTPSEKSEGYARSPAEAYYQAGPLESANHAKIAIDNEKYYQPPVENVQVRSHLETTGYHKDIDIPGYPRSSASENNSYLHSAADVASFYQKTDAGFPRVPESSPNAEGFARESPKNADVATEYLSLSERVSHHPSQMTNHVSQLRDVTDAPRRAKKKNVTFCDEVILVATADDDEDDPFIPNPILERVLRSAFRPAQAEARVVPAAGTAVNGTAAMGTVAVQGGHFGQQQVTTAQMHQPPASANQTINQNHQTLVQNQHASMQNHQALAQNQQSAVQSHQSAMQNHLAMVQNHQASVQNHQPSVQNQQQMSMQNHQATVQHQQAAMQSQSSVLHNLQGALQNHQAALQNHQTGLQNYSPGLQNHQTGLQNHQAALQNNQAGLQNHLSGLPNHLSSTPNHPAQPSALQAQNSTSQMQQVSYQMQQASLLSQQTAASPASQYRDFQSPGCQSQAPYAHYQQVPSNSAKYQQYVASGQSQDGQQAGNQQVPTRVQSPNGNAQQYQHVPVNSQQYQQNAIPRYQHVPNQQRLGQRLHQQSPTYGQQAYPSGIPQYQQSTSQIPTSQSYQLAAANGAHQVPSGQPQYYQQASTSKLQQPVYQRVPLSVPNGGGSQNGGHPPYQHPPMPRQQAGPRPGYQPAAEGSVARPVYQSVPENAAVRQVQSTDGQARPAYQPASENGMQRPVYQQDSVQSRVMYQGNQESGPNRVAYQTNQESAQSRLYPQNGDGLPNRSAGQPALESAQQPRPPYQQNHDSGQPRPVYQQVPETGQPVAKAGPCHLCRKKPVASPAIYCTDCHFYMSRFKPRA